MGRNLQVLKSTMSAFNLDSVWEEYYPKVYGYFFRRVNTREDVEDMTSMTMTQFCQTLQNPEKTQKIKSLNAYLWKIAHNQLADFIRFKTKRPITVGFDDNANFVDESVEKLQSRYFDDRKVGLLKCIQKSLDKIDLTIVVDSVINDYKSEELAIKLGLSASNIRQKLSRSLKKLRQKCRQVWLDF